MKRFLAKILSVFFLTILLSSNMLSLYVYFNDEVQELNHCQSDHDNKEKTPCITCILAFSLTNLNYNNNPEFSFESLTLIQQVLQKKQLVYVETLHKRLCLSSNKNKAPPCFT